MSNFLSARTTRKLFLAAIAAALAATPGSANTLSLSECDLYDEVGGLSCNDGNQIMFCNNTPDNSHCYVGCGGPTVQVDCDLDPDPGDPTPE